MSPNYGIVKAASQRGRGRSRDLTSGVDESTPFDLWHETSDKVRVKISLPESYLNVFELKGKVI